MGRLEGKVAFVTGAARGQGRSHAVRFAEEGADIIALDVVHDIATVPYPLGTPDELEETKRAVEALDRRILAYRVDVRDSDGVAAALADAVSRLGRLDIVVANAGILSFGALSEMDESTWQNMVDVNLTGVWVSIDAAVPHILAGGAGGTILMTSSTSGLRAYPGVGHYVAAKHGVLGLMKTLAQELAPHSIRVNAIAPTQVDTPMVQNEGLYRVWSPGTPNPTRADFERASSAAIPLSIPWVDPADVSNAMVFLASDEARYITGVCLPVDGGTLVA
jgi:(+)-trans-carveol dehydrogenase